VKRKLGYKIHSEEDHMDKATRESLDDLAENIRKIKAGGIGEHGESGQ
jgi:hypothetical protein